MERTQGCGRAGDRVVVAHREGGGACSARFTPALVFSIERERSLLATIPNELFSETSKAGRVIRKYRIQLLQKRVTVCPEKKRKEKKKERALRNDCNPHPFEVQTCRISTRFY